MNTPYKILCLALRNDTQAICTNRMHYEGPAQIINISAKLLPLDYSITVTGILPLLGFSGLLWFCFRA